MDKFPRKCAAMGWNVLEENVLKKVRLIRFLLIVIYHFIVVLEDVCAAENVKCVDFSGGIKRERECCSEFECKKRCKKVGKLG